MGAAIVTVWRERRFLHLIGTYFLAVVLHGLWNTFAMLFTFSTLSQLIDQPGRLSALQPMLITVMSILTATLFTILLISNLRMQNTLPLTGLESPISPQPGDQLPE
jgi:hypothetical protein